MERPELAAPDLYGTTHARLANAAEVDAIVQGWTLQMTTTDLVSFCASRDVPCASVNSIEQIFADPHIADRQNLVTLAHAVLGPVTVPAVLPRLSATPGSVTTLGPVLGASNEDIYRGVLNIGLERMDALKESGVI